FSATKVLKPGCCAVSRYVPRCKSGTSKSPFSLVRTRRCSFVSLLVSVIWTSPTAAPAGSVAVPRTVESVSWANNAETHRNAAIARYTTECKPRLRKNSFDIEPLLRAYGRAICEAILAQNRVEDKASAILDSDSVTERCQA